MLGWIAAYAYLRKRRSYSNESVQVVIAALADETGVPIEELLADMNLWEMLRIGRASYDDCLNYIYTMWG
jgi:hypothetical protein